MSNMLNLNSVGYARVSTKSGEQLSSLETQKNRLKAVGVDKVYCDVESGRSNDRKAFNELLQLIDKKAIKEIVVTRYDRLGRDATFIDAALVLASKKNVVIRTIDTGIVNVETPAGFLMSRISTSLAEMESKMLSLRVKKALEQKWKDGDMPRSRLPWGYHKVEREGKKCVELHPIEGERAKELLFELKENGYRLNVTLKKFKDIPLSTPSSVRAWIANPVLRGGMGFEKYATYKYKRVVWGLHEPLIMHEDWFVIQRLLDLNKSTWGRSAGVKPKLLTGICYCGECNHKLGYASRKAKTHQLNLRCNTFKCSNYMKLVKESLITKAINKSLAKRSGELASLTKEEPPEVIKVRSEIDMLSKLDDPDLREAITRKKEKLASLLLVKSPVMKERAQMMASSDFWDHAASLPDNRLREIYLEFVLKAVAKPKQVTQIFLRI